MVVGIENTVSDSSSNINEVHETGLSDFIFSDAFLQNGKRDGRKKETQGATEVRGDLV